MPNRPSLRQQVVKLTERVRELEAELKIGPEVYSIADNSPSNIMLLDREARVRYINRTVPDLTVEQVLGTPVFAFVGEEFHEDMRRAFARAAQTREPDRYETWYEAENGERSWWESSVGCVVQGGEVVGFAVVSTNVTEQRRRTEEQERFFNLSVDMLCVASLDGYFKRVNPAFKATLGYEHELLTKPFLDFVHPDDIEQTQAAVAYLQERDVIVDFENRYRCKDGSYRWLSWHGVLDRTSNSVYAVARDVTERRSLEEQLRHSQKMDAIGKLAGGVAHDFNNLLLAMQGNIEFAMRPVTRNPHEYLQEAMKAAERAAVLTKQMLAFGRRQPIRSEQLKLDGLIDNLNNMLRRLIPASIDIAVVSRGGLRPIVADRSQLEQVVINLCVNARDAIADGGRVELVTENVLVDATQARSHAGARPGEYVRLSVVDTGSGIGDDVKEHLFEPFFTTKEPGRGTGLGLATVYGIVQQHGGFIEVKSKLGHGTTFGVYLPVAEGTTVGAPQQVPEHLIRGGNEVILVAEDEVLVRDVVVQMLERGGYEVIVASDGEQAVRVFKQHADRIALVLLDVVMPRLNGPDAATLIRHVRPDMRVLFSSGYVETSLATDQLKRERMVHKPYKPAELLREVREALDAEPESAA